MTPQHVYAKWNQALFHETYKAFREGRTDVDPSIAWYEGEKGFFDFYIIPLAKKLSKCGVFGVSSDEFLNYARSNRSEWEAKGQAMIQDYLANFETKYGENAHEEADENLLRGRLMRHLGASDRALSDIVE